MKIKICTCAVCESRCPMQYVFYATNEVTNVVKNMLKCRRMVERGQYLNMYKIFAKY